MKKLKQTAEIFVDVLFRGAVGLVFICLFSYVCKRLGWPLLAGINPATFCILSILGLPGFFLIIGIGLAGYF